MQFEIKQMNDGNDNSYINDLQFELSPYLKQHEKNPVNWQSWSEKTLVQAKLENKLILVSVGYSTCHWCHVMAHESFDDPEIAEIMNACFINVKIDREERPDLDHYFMNAVQAMGISGGWPLHCFLSPEGKPFFGGTYFPPESRYGRPSWRQILMAVFKAYREKPTEIIQQADELSHHLNALNQITIKHLETKQKADPENILMALQAFMDLRSGGFGTQPKFPNTLGIQLLFQLYGLTGNRNALDHACFSLDQISKGGIFDHVDGGFFRYSVDDKWNVPHFEKMLYDHAQMMQTLALAYQFRPNSFLQKIIEQSFRFFENELMHENGLFFAAMDADSEGQEGYYYTWTEAELKSVTGDKFEEFFHFYEYHSLDHTHTDKKVLRIKSTADVHQALSYFPQLGILEKLKTYRSKRQKPAIDQKLIVSWNAMLVSAYLQWYKVSENKNALQQALQLLKKLIEISRIDGSHLCRYSIGDLHKGVGFLEDYAFTIKALLESYFYTGEDESMQKALQFYDVIEREYLQNNSALFTIASSSTNDFNIPQLDWQESTVPNANAILCWACSYFYHFTGKDSYLKRAEAMIAAIKEQALSHPLAMASWLQQILVLEWDIVVLKTHPTLKGLDQINGIHLPGLIRLNDMSIIPGELVFCFQGVCHPPVRTKEEIVSLFSKYQYHLDS